MMRFLLAAIFNLLTVCFCLSQNLKQQIVDVLHEHDLQEASWALQQSPVTVTATHCERSAGSLHDFYSEGDYWWPDPSNPGGPYIQRDGLSNPQNFTAHRQAMIRLSNIIGSLASAYLLTQDEQYVQHAITHLKAWFIDEKTLMNPNLQYAQAIKGRVTGRSIGIIDTIHLMEVAQGVIVLSKAPAFDQAVLAGIKKWFESYIQWLTTHAYGVEEMNAKNNHGTCWVMQVAAFARLTGQKEIMNFCATRYQSVLLPMQMDADGSFPLELKRTKPYGYSIFNLDAMAMICHMLNDRGLWHYKTADNKSIKNGIDFLYPYLDNKNKWPFPKDVMYWEQWPVAQPALVFGALAFNKGNWLTTWMRLNHFPEEQEVIRNLPVRHPIIWIDGLETK